MTTLGKPSVYRRDRGAQLSYDLPHRVYDAKIYPRKSSNGSTVIIYGHEHGIRILWRGGRPFRSAAKKSEQKPKSNGAAKDSVMVLDTDDDEPAQAAALDAEFEEAENQRDSEDPYDAILRQVDVPLGSKALHIAVCSNIADLMIAENSSSFLASHIVIAVVCADCSSRIISLPLTPPALANKQISQLGIRTIKLFGNQDVPSGVAMTLACQSRAKSPTRQEDSENDWHLLIATNSPEAAGLLLIYRVSIIKDKASNYQLSTTDTAPAQKQYLASPASKISFNGSSSHTPRHSHLLVSFSSGSVKIYSCSSTKSPVSSRGRRSSAASIDTATTNGGWLLSLYPGFQDSVAQGVRKFILDAQWVLGGKAIIALFPDGEWGIWDVEGAGPGGNSNTLLRGQNVIQGITGGAIASFSTSGWLPSDDTKAKSQQQMAEVESKPKLAPMTPSTRRIREDSLFKAGEAPGGGRASAKGGITVSQIKGTTGDMAGDETLLFWHGERVFVLSSILSAWRSSAKSTGILEASHRRKAFPVENIRLLGETLQTAQIFTSTESSLRQSRQPDILIVSDHRLIIIAASSGISEVESTGLTLFKKASTNHSTSLFGARRQDAQSGFDDEEMEIDDINKALDGMANSSGNKLFINGSSGHGDLFGGSTKRQTGFA